MVIKKAFIVLQKLLQRILADNGPKSHTSGKLCWSIAKTRRGPQENS